ncbi:hypothetical protein ACJRO7_027875 [Eucalyptus globulus]|uniref:non-specific serine/threonine protein kinase n=1 Tax=Eucalyptus globulus TaxID=34317 RepID=A0ABD3JSP3_EUCGL
MRFRYASEVNVERAEDVLTHKRLLESARDPANRLAIDVRLVQVLPPYELRTTDSVHSGSTIKSEDVSSTSFGSSPNLELLALEGSESLTKDGDNSVHANAQFSRPMHEITFSSEDKPKLLSQLTSLLADVGLNIQEAHETEQLRIALEKEALKHEKHARTKFHASFHLSNVEQTGIKKEHDHLSIPNDGIDVWEIDLNNLKFEKKVASGSYGDLYKGTYCSQDVAIKVLKHERLNEELQREFAQEVFIMRKVRHKNVVQFIGACTKSPNLYIVTEFMSGGSVYDYLHKQKGVFKLPMLLKVAIDVAKGMHYLHQNNIIHRDLKAANLLMDENEVFKVADFGVARVKAQSGVMTAETGTYRWMAPEVIEHRPYDHKADVFSFGIVLWELLTGKLPYEYLTPLQAAVGVVQKGLRPTIPKHTHPKLGELLQSCWQGNAKMRPDFVDIITILQQIAKEVAEEGEDRRKEKPGKFLSVLRRGHH